MTKRLFLTLALVGFSMAAQAQGLVQFNTHVGSVDAQIFQYWGTLDMYPPYHIGGWDPLIGTGYYAQLYAADGFNAPESSLLPKGSPVTFGTGSAAGYVIAGTVVVSDAAGPVTIEVRAWSSQYPTYEAAQAAFGPAGKSNPININALASSTVPPSLPPDLVGLQSFGLIPVVPEPSTVALGALGLAVLAFCRRGR